MEKKKILSKSTHILNESDFICHYELYEQYDWLLDRVKGLESLWSFLNEEERNLIKKLFPLFRIMNYNEIIDKLVEITSTITEDWQCTPQNTIIVAICKNSKPDGSQWMVDSLKTKFEGYEWGENNICNRFDEFLLSDKIMTKRNIILCDDFIGSGKTIASRIKEINKKIDEKNNNRKWWQFWKPKLRNINIYIVGIAGMEDSHSVIMQNGTSDCHIGLWLKKGIRDRFQAIEKEHNVKIMKGIELKLAKNIKKNKLKDVNFGWKEAEALFYFDGRNIPNNVFPIFWWPKLENGQDIIPLFKRAL